MCACRAMPLEHDTIAHDEGRAIDVGLHEHRQQARCACAVGLRVR